MMCENGCGQEAKFQLKNGKWICSKSSNSCPINKKKNSNGMKKVWKDPSKSMSTKQLDNKRGWSKGLTVKTDKRVEKLVETRKRKIKSGELIPAFLGKKHTKETKEKLSQAACKNNCNNGFIKTKYYKIWCPYEKKEIKVQGSWEFKYAKWLNQNNIDWVRSRKINLRFKYYENDFLHTYYPDFYLVNSNEFIEIKGYWFKNDVKDDKLKMKCVKEQNLDKKILILEKKDLLNLGIKL